MAVDLERIPLCLVIEEHMVVVDHTHLHRSHAARSGKNERRSAIPGRTEAEIELHRGTASTVRVVSSVLGAPPEEGLSIERVRAADGDLAERGRKEREEHERGEARRGKSHAGAVWACGRAK